MTDVLDTIEWELLTAIRRSNARRRRRRRLGLFGGAALSLTVATAGVATVGPTALDRLLDGSDAPTAEIRALPDAPRGTIKLDDAAGDRWTLSLHRTDGGFVVLAALPDELPTDRFAPVVGRNPLGIVADLVDGPVISVGPAVAKRDGTVSRLLVGEVDAAARAVTIVLDGRRYETRLTPQVVSAPIVWPPARRILPQGRALKARVGHRLRLRAFAVALPADALPAGTQTIEGTVETELDDGRRVTEPIPSTCVSARCGVTVFKLPDQDG